MKMHFGDFSYIVTTLIFAAGAVVIEWALGFRRLWRSRRLIAIVIVIGWLATAVGESFALRWRTWQYNPDRTLGLYFLGAAAETYLYATLVAIAVASATIAWAKYEEEGLPLIATTAVKLVRKLRGWGYRLRGRLEPAD